MSTAEAKAKAKAKALSLWNYNGTDGFVGFDRTASWTFDPSNRAVPGKFDVVGVVEHEISGVLGRIADLGAIGGTLDPLDLFRYSAPNTRGLSPAISSTFRSMAVPPTWTLSTALAAVIQETGLATRLTPSTRPR